MSDTEAPPEAESTAPLPIRRIYALARPELRYIGGAFVCLLIGGSTMLIWPQLVRRIVDQALGAPAGERLGEAGAGAELHDAIMNRAAILLAFEQLKQAEKEGIDLTPLQGVIEHARKKSATKALNDSTWIGSDHRPIWVQIKI